MIGTIREKALKIKTVSKLNTEKSHHTRPVLIFAVSWDSFRTASESEVPMIFGRQMKNQNVAKMKWIWLLQS